MHSSAERDALGRPRLRALFIDTLSTSETAPDYVRKVMELLALNNYGRAEDFDYCGWPRASTRAGLLGALAEFSRAVRPGDAVLLYYSGHGGVVRLTPDPRLPAAWCSGEWPCICPGGAEPGQTSPEQLVFTAEIHHVLREEIARKTDNITTLFDCCYSGAMITSSDRRTRDELWPPRIRAPASLLAFHERVASASTSSSAERAAAGIVSIQATENASKAVLRGHRPLLTTKLSEAIWMYTSHEGVPVDVPWETLIGFVNNELVSFRQQPSVVGPRGRIPFTHRSVDVSNRMDAVLDGEQLWLLRGRLDGIEEGDEVKLVNTTIGRIRAVVCEARPCNARVEARPEHRKVVEGKQFAYFEAFLERKRRPSRVAVRVESLNPNSESLEAVVGDLAAILDASPRLALAAPGEDADFEVEVDRHGTTVCAGAGHPRRLPQSQRGAAADLDALSRARAFAEFFRSPSMSKQRAAPPLVEFRLTRRVGERELELRSGESLRCSDELELRITNLGPRTCWVTVVEQDVSGRLRAYDAQCPVELRGHGSFEFAPRRCHWPLDIPLGDLASAFRLHLVATSSRLDMDMVTTRMVPYIEQLGDSKSPLESRPHRTLIPVDEVPAHKQRFIEAPVGRRAIAMLRDRAARQHEDIERWQLATLNLELEPPVRELSVVIEAGEDGSCWRIHDAHTPEQEPTRLALPDELWRRWAALRPRARASLPERDVTARDELLECAREIGAALYEQVFVRAGFEGRLAAQIRPRAPGILRVKVCGDARHVEKVCELPWELLYLGGEFPAREGKLHVIREVGSADPRWRVDGDRLQPRLLVHMADPEGDELNSSVARFHLGSRLAAVRELTRFSALGSVEDLMEGMVAHRPSILCLWGHGTHEGEFVFEAGHASSERLGAPFARSIDELMQWAFRDHVPDAVWLACCHGDLMAPRIHRHGVQQVLAYVDPVELELAEQVDRLLFQELLDRGCTVDAVRWARASMGRSLELDGQRVDYPLAWAMLTLYHRGPIRPLGYQSSTPTSPFVSQSLYHRNNPLDGLEDGFIGRRGLLAELRRVALDPGAPRWIGLYGHAGLGKSATMNRLASILRLHAQRHLVHVGLDELSDDDAPTRFHALRDLLAERLEPEAFAMSPEQLARSVVEQTPGALIYLDPLEVLIEVPEGESPRWVSPELQRFFEALARALDDQRGRRPEHHTLILACARVRPRGYGHWLAIDTCEPSDLAHMMAWQRPLARYGFAQRQELARRLHGLPGAMMQLLRALEHEDAARPLDELDEHACLELLAESTENDELFAHLRPAEHELLRLHVSGQVEARELLERVPRLVALGLLIRPWHGERGVYVPPLMIALLARAQASQIQPPEQLEQPFVAPTREGSEWSARVRSFSVATGAAALAFVVGRVFAPGVEVPSQGSVHAPLEAVDRGRDGAQTQTEAELRREDADARAGPGCPLEGCSKGMLIGATRRLEPRRATELERILDIPMLGFGRLRRSAWTPEVGARSLRWVSEPTEPASRSRELRVSLSCLPEVAASSAPACLDEGPALRVELLVQAEDAGCARDWDELDRILRHLLSASSSTLGPVAPPLAPAAPPEAVTPPFGLQAVGKPKPRPSSVVPAVVFHRDPMAQKKPNQR